MNRNGALTYRMKLDGFCWHYHKECDQYPQTNYKIITTNAEQQRQQQSQ